jgi:hypothetical protein
MEEVVSSNLTRSTKTFHTLGVFWSLGNYSLESEWSPKMDASDEGARERPRGHPNAVFSCQFSPQPSPPYKNPTNLTNRT